MKNILRYIQNLFKKKITVFKWQFNFTVFISLSLGIVLGSYFGISKILKTFAVNDTIQTWTFNIQSANTFTYDTDFINVNDNGAHLGVNKLTNPTFDQDLAGWSGVQSYLLDDEFTDTRAAGSVNGTSATPGPGTRTVTDTNNKLSIGNGTANIATGGVGNGDPGLWYPSMNRTVGRVIVSKGRFGASDSYLMGLDSDQSSYAGYDGFHFNGTTVTAITLGQSKGLGTVAHDVDYQIAFVVKGTGTYYYIKGGSYTNWTLLYISPLGNGASFYPSIMSGGTTSSISSSDYLRVPSSTWLPTPLAYDTFTRSDGLAGSTESTGPDSQTTERMAWSGGSISGNKLVVTPTTGSDIVTNGNMESGDPPSGWSPIATPTITSVSDERTGGSGSKSMSVARNGVDWPRARQTFTLNAGTWYFFDGWMKNIDAPGAALSFSASASTTTVGNTASITWVESIGIARSTATSGYLDLSPQTNTGTQSSLFDDIVVKPLVTSSLFATVATSTKAVVATTNITAATRTQAGVVTNMDSVSNPGNFIIAYFDRTDEKIRLDKVVNGTYTNLINVAISYSAGAPLSMITDNSSGSLKVRVYYNNALVGSEQSISDASIINNTNHGIFSTYSGNTFDNFSLFARGTGGEYNDIPAEDLTATYDTGIKYQGNGSAKLIAAGNDANFVQSVNTGDTSVYTLITYAYTDGGAVTGSDVTLYHDTSTIPTQYTSVGGGWYRLTGTISGAASSKNMGVRVKAGKTVYVDEFLLYKQGEVLLTNSKFEGGVTGWSGTQSYTLDDEYSDTKAAGSVNGTSASPVGGTREVIDTENKLSISNGRLNVDPKSTATWGNPSISYDAITRGAGKVFITEVTNSNLGAGAGAILGFQSAKHNYSPKASVMMYPLLLMENGVGEIQVAAGPTLGVSYKIAAVLRTSGWYFYIKGGVYTNWTLLWVDAVDSTATLYPSLTNYNNSFTSDFVRIPTSTWLPSPLVYDTFARADGTVGSSETTGPDIQTTPSLAWTGGSISGNKMVITPTIGDELIVNGNMESGDPPDNWSTNATIKDGVADERPGGAGVQAVSLTNGGGIYQDLSTTAGTWFIADWWCKKVTGNVSMIVYSGPGYSNNIFSQSSTSTSWVNKTRTFRTAGATPRVYPYMSGVAGEEGRFDDVSIKPLTLSSLFSTVSSSDSDVIVDVDVTVTSATQGGLVLNLDSTSNPQNFVIAYHDGTKVYLEKAVNGVYTQIQNTTVTYVAGATLRVIKDGTKYRVYYNNALVGTEQTISDAGIISNTKHGIFSTYAGNTFDNFTLFARGTGGEYTDIPAEDLTVSYSTAQHHTGNGSAQLVSGGNNANYVQSINVGDTSTYSLVTYARTDGSAVSASDLELYYNNSTLLTTYTDAGNGWYKLSGTFIGIASSKDLGVRVKANKTIYVDDISLYQQSAYSIFNTDGYHNPLATSWDSFSSQVTTPGNSTVKYQICTNDGSTCESGVGAAWKYWNGSVWTAATNLTTHTNTADQLTQEVMQQLDVLTQKISVKVIMNPDNLNFPNVASVSVGLTTDTTDPINATASRLVKTQTLSCSYNDNCWTNSASPKFSWTAGDDNESGLKGYCLYLGTDETGDPAHVKGKLGTSPNPLTDTSCQFIITGDQLDLVTNPSYLATALSNSDTFTTSPNTYYLNIKSIDYAGNTSDTSETIRFQYDGVRPTNVSYISTSAGNFSNVVDMSFSWPTSGNGVSSDSESDVLGWQYQINTTDADGWKGTTHSDELNIDYIPVGTGLYQLTQKRDGSSIVSGNNVVYFRTVDNTGNFSTDATVRTGNLSYGGQAPYFGGTDKVTVTPSTNTTNSFALSWPAATANVGNSVTHYYYSINTPPASTYAALSSNVSTFIDNGTSRTVSAAALPNVNKDSNTVYVVAIDDAGTPNYSPSNVITGTFTLNSTNPDNVGNLVASDSSIKSQSQWNVTLTWTAPVYQGAGNLVYEIFRSTDGETFAQVGTSRGLSYVDNAPQSAPYFYKVVTKDGANALSSGSNAVLITPTGRWTVPASLESQPLATSITTKKAQISWSTGRTSDSKVAFGTKTGVYNEEEPSNSDQVTSHSITLSGLNPNTTYYYVSKWTDEDGNTGESEEKMFKTQPAPIVKNVLSKNIGLNSAIIQFTSKGASKVKIYYGESTSFGGAKEIETSPVETTYTVELTGLKDGVKYYYRINAFDAESSEYEGTVLDFTTLPRPRISNVVLQEVAGTSQTTILVTWNTNTEVSSIVTYYPEGKYGDARDEVLVNLVKGEHKMIVRGLLPQTNYYLIVKGRDRIGNEAESESFKFTTSTDSRPPFISKLGIEGTTLQEGSSQLIVSWATDEPSTSQVEYGEGTGSTYQQRSQLDSNLTLNHIVIISGLTPSKVYHLRVVSSDKAGNIGRSIDTVTIAPKSTDNALNLVITNLQQIFGIFGK